MARDNFFKLYWQEKVEKQRIEAKRGIVRASLIHSRLHIAAPYNERFNAGAKEMGAVWRYRSLVWSFPKVQRRLIVKLIAECYGVERVPYWLLRDEVKEGQS